VHCAGQFPRATWPDFLKKNIKIYNLNNINY
jgi:hypothetical protein